jgi:tight adherence protein C
MTDSQLLFVAATVLAAIATGLVVVASTSKPPVRSTEVGLRGYKRHKALESSLGFSLLEPALRLLAAWVAWLPLGGFRSRINTMLVHAGDYLGLTDDELIGMCVLSGGVGVGVAIAVGGYVPNMLLQGLIVGLAVYYPYTHVRSVAVDRQREISRRLPGAMDLMSLCMSAGLDFPGALRALCVQKGKDSDPLIEEFELILHNLRLGHSRRHALQGFTNRVPAEVVRDFVAAVTQAEDKGNPLREVMRVQAGVLRLRRSIAAEEASTRASLAMVLPLALALLATLTLIVGPLMIRTMFPLVG